MDGTVGNGTHADPDRTCPDGQFVGGGVRLPIATQLPPVQTVPYAQFGGGVGLGSVIHDPPDSTVPAEQLMALLADVACVTPPTESATRDTGVTGTPGNDVPPLLAGEVVAFWAQAGPIPIPK